jgi:hypothetical protein
MVKWFAASAILVAVAVAALLKFAESRFKFDSAKVERSLRSSLESRKILPEMRGAASRMVEAQDASEAQVGQEVLNAWQVHFLVPQWVGGKLVGVGFEFGCADRHYGVIICPATDDVPNAPNVKKWSPGIWFYSEIP